MQPYFLNQLSDLIIPNLMKTPNFSRSFHHIDWKVIASINLEELVQSYDLNILNKLLPHIVFCNIANEFTERIDPIFLKLYRLAQIIIEYFIHTQHQFTERFSALQKEHDQLKSHFQLLVTDIEEKKQLLKQISSKSRSQGNNSNHVPSVKLLAGAHFLCKFCGKQFYTQAFLSTHIEKRHVPSNENFYPRESPSHIPCDVPLNLAIIAERNFESQQKERFSRNDQDLFSSINERIIEQFATLEQKLEKLILEQEVVNGDHFENLKKESKRNGNEFNLFKQRILVEIKEQGVKSLHLENAMENFQELIIGMRFPNRSSNLGELEDDTVNISPIKCENSNHNHSEHERENMGILISKKILIELDNLYHRLCLNQTDFLRTNSIDPMTSDNSIHISAEEKFVRFKSDILEILAQCLNHAKNLSSDIFHNNSQPSNFSLNLQPKYLSEEVYSISEEISTDNVVHDKNGNISTLDIDSPVVPYFTDPQNCATSPIHFETVSECAQSHSSDNISCASKHEAFLGNIIDLSQILQNDFGSKNSLEAHQAITILDNATIPFESIFFNECSINSFLPFPNKWSRLKSKYGFEYSELDLLRNEVRSLLLQKLLSSDILTTRQGVTKSQFNFLMNNLKSYQNKYSNKQPEFFILRKIIEKDLQFLIEGFFETKLLCQFSTPKKLPILEVDLLKVNQPNKPIVSETFPVILESPIKFKSDPKSLLTSPNVEINNSKFDVRMVRNILQSASWDSDNSELEQDFNNLLSEFTGKYSPLPNSVVTADKDHSSKTIQYKDFEHQSGSMPSDFSLSDITTENIEDTNADT